MTPGRAESTKMGVGKGDFEEETDSAKSSAKYQIQTSDVLFKKCTTERQPERLCRRPLLGSLVDPACCVVQNHAGGTEQGRIHQVRNHHVHILNRGQGLPADDVLDGVDVVAG